MKQTKVLVTGATGFLGRNVVRRLVEEGYPVRALARRKSGTDALKIPGLDIAFGDLGDAVSIAAAVKDVQVVVHAAAGTSGTAQDSDTATILGTRNVLEACRANHVEKLVYISSLSVYEVAGYAENELVTEEARLERFPSHRGPYSAAKLHAENLVTGAAGRGGCRAVVLRPGTLYGPGAKIYTNMMGVSFARRIFLVFGSEESALPLVHVDNVADSIVACIDNSAADNQVFNVVDRELITKKMYIDRLVKPLYSKATVIYCPMPILLVLTWLQEKLLPIIGKRPFLTVYRLRSSQRRVRYDTSKIEKAIGWRSRIRFEEGAEQVIRAHRQAADAGAPHALP